MFTKGNAKALGAKGGAARRDLLTQHLISELNEIDPAANVTKARLLVRSLVDNAVGGDTQAQREVFDRVEGKPVQTNENFNHTDVERLSDDELAQLLTQGIADASRAASRVLEKANGSTKPH